MLKTGLHLFFCTLGILASWVLDLPFLSGPWVRALSMWGLGGSAFFLITWYLSLKWTLLHHRVTRQYEDWLDDDDLEPSYVRR